MEAIVDPDRRRKLSDVEAQRHPVVAFTVEEREILRGFRLAEEEGRRLMLAAARDVIARAAKSNDATHA